jgi:hypothetical protein
MIDTIVQSRHKNTKKGIFYPSTLRQLWTAPEYPEDIHDFLLSLLDRFGISFCIHPLGGGGGGSSGSSIEENSGTASCVCRVLCVCRVRGARACAVRSDEDW